MGRLIRMNPVRAGWAVVLRVCIDALLVNVALIAAFAARAVGILVFTSPDTAVARDIATVIDSSTQAYFVVGPLVTVIALATFAANGFYSYGRAYRGRYKALIVLEAVSITYLVVATVAYFFQSTIGHVPRSTWALGWLFTLALVGGVRLASSIWRVAVFREARQVGKPSNGSVHNVLVIGGAGYLGSVLCRQLLDRGYNVTTLDALIYGGAGIRDLLDHPRFALVEGDLRHIEATIRAMEHQDAVIHLGGLVGDPACAMDRDLTLEINTAATRMLAETARGFGVKRFIFASSCSVYGAGDEMLDERSALKPVSLYAETKLDSERILLDLASPEFAPTVLRFATLFGLSPRPRFDLVVNLLTAMATIDDRVTVFGGEQWRPFVHVADCAHAIVRSLEAPVQLVGGEVFNVGSNDLNLRIEDVGRLVAEAVPTAELIVDVDREDSRNYRVSFDKIAKRLNFSPRYDVTMGIGEMREALEAGLVDDFRLALYSNVRGLSELEDDHLVHRMSAGAIPAHYREMRPAPEPA